MLFIAIILVGALLYWKGWLTITRTGLLKPLVNLTVLGFAISIRKPSDDSNG